MRRQGTTSLSTMGKLVLLGSLYLSQGLPFGFFTQALPVFLRQQGVSLTAISLTSLLSLPWALKFLWSPWVDAVGRGRVDQRQRWILPLQLGAALTMFAVAWLDPKQALWAVLGAVLVANALAATQDIATDGMATQLLSASERGWGNGVQVAGYRVGMIVGGGALLIVYDRAQWSGTFLVLSALILAATAPLVVTWPASDPGHGQPQTPSVGPSVGPSGERLASAGLGLGLLRALPRFFRRPGMAAWTVLIGVYKLGDAMLGGMLRPWLVDQGMDTEQLGWLLGGAGFSAGLVGAMAGGALAGVLGRRRALLVCGAAQAVGLASYLPLVYGLEQLEALYAACVFDHLTGGMATAALFTCMMDRCREDSAATDYTIMASVVVMATGVGQAVGGPLVTATSYAEHFTLSVVVSALGVAAASALWSRATPATTAQAGDVEP